MLILVSITFVMQTAAAGSIGVAAAAGDGRICAAMSAPALAPGAALTLIQADGAQSLLYASVVRAIPGCERLERALVPGPYYLAQLSGVKTADAAALWVALSGKLPTRRVASGISVRLSPVYPHVQVRSCTSREGVHLTAWSGTPLSTQRLWHQYYYLGYDVEPSCDHRDSRSR
jgi:hypothetical protein